MPEQKKPKVILDSTVLVSAFLTRGLAAELLTRCRERARIYTAEDILQEVRRVLLEKSYIRKHYRYSSADVEVFVNGFRENALLIEQLPDLHVVERDPKDDKILARAVAAGADYIVSRDLDLLGLKTYQGIQIVAPEDFIHYLRNEKT